MCQGSHIEPVHREYEFLGHQVELSICPILSVAYSRDENWLLKAKPNSSNGIVWYLGIKKYKKTKNLTHPKHLNTVDLPILDIIANSMKSYNVDVFVLSEETGLFPS